MCDLSASGIEEVNLIGDIPESESAADTVHGEKIRSLSARLVRPEFEDARVLPRFGREADDHWGSIRMSTRLEEDVSRPL